ncbi:MAG: hypothetical protein JWN37_302 [Candidatus Nomurabacteria bacterium]|nr:hypothetical protein [Candidatus Nomurabacteria bacterium]
MSQSTTASAARGGMMGWYNGLSGTAQLIVLFLLLIVLSLIAFATNYVTGQANMGLLKQRAEVMKQMDAAAIPQQREIELRSAKVELCRNAEEMTSAFEKAPIEKAAPGLVVPAGCVWARATRHVSVSGSNYYIAFDADVPGNFLKCGPLGDMEESCDSIIGRKLGTKFRVIVRNGGEVNFN